MQMWACAFTGVTQISYHLSSAYSITVGNTKFVQMRINGLVPFGMVDDNYISPVCFIPRSGTPITAAADGRIKYVGNKTHRGNVIIIDHTKGYQTIYAHLHKIGVCCGDTVSRGQMIG